MMTRTTWLISIALLALSVACASAQAPDVDTLLADLGSGDGNLRLTGAQELAKLGAAPLPRLLEMVGGPDQRLAAGARLAIGWLVQEAAAPGAAGQAAVEQILVETAAGDEPIEARRFALRQLALVGTDAAVPRLAQLLGQPDVAEMARYALARIPGEAATTALAEATASAEGALRIGAINALGLRGDPGGLAALKAALGDDDAQVRMAAAQALGHIPSSAVVALLREAFGRGSAQEQRITRDAYIQLGGTLLAAGMRDEAVGIFEQAYGTFAAPSERCAGLLGLAKAQGTTAAPTLIKAVREGPLEVRGTAKYALAEMEGAEVTEAVGNASREGTAEARTALIWVLGERGDAAAVSPVRAALRGPETEVRVAALNALAKLQDGPSARGLIPLLADPEDTVRKAAEAALGRLPGEEAAQATIAALPDASPETKPVLVRILGLHLPEVADATLMGLLEDPDEGVRISAIQALGRHQSAEAVPGLVAASVSDTEKAAKAASDALASMTAAAPTERMMELFETGQAPERGAVLRALGGRTDPELLDLFLTAAQDKSDAVAVAALDAIGRLQAQEAAPTVLEIARDGSDKTKAAAVAAYLQIGAAKVRDDREGALAMFHEALELAPTDTERRLALERIGGIGDPTSLPLVRPLAETGSDDVKKAAAGALVSIAEALGASGRTAEAEELITGNIALLDDRDLLRRASATMRAIGKPLQLAAKQGLLTEYWVLGPIGNRDDMTKGDALPTDAPVDITQPVRYGDGTFEWQYRPVDDPLGHLDLEKAAARRDDTAAYAYVEFEAPEAQDVVLRIGSDDGVVCWLNGEKVHEFIGNRGWSLDQDTAQTRLKAGTNRVLCKVLNGGAQWALSVRITDPDGKPIVVKQWTKTPADIVAAKGYVTRLFVLGPLAGREAVRNGSPVDPAAVDVTQPVRFGDEERNWRLVQVTDQRGMLDLERAVARQDDVGCYAYAELVSERDQDVLLKIGSDDDVYCWLNGESVLEHPVNRAWAADADVVETGLKAGVNRLLLKVLQGGGQWAVSLRVTDREGNPLVLRQPTE